LGRYNAGFSRHSRHSRTDNGLSTWFVVRLQREEIAASKEALEQYQLEAATKISAANAAGEAAKADAAEANRKAETERSERLKLEAQFAWRRIDDARQAEMVSELSKNPQSVFVIWITGDPEAKLLAWQLIAIFQKSHWHAGGEGRQYPDSIVTNVVVAGPGAPSVSTLLARVGLSPGPGPLPPFSGMIVPHETGVTEANANVVILIGSRLRPADTAVMDAVKGQLRPK
jgi:hypothetical protein